MCNSLNLANWFTEAINESYVFPFRELNSALKNNPIQFADSSFAILERIKRGHAVAFLQDDHSLNFRFMENCGLFKIYHVSKN